MCRSRKTPWQLDVYGPALQQDIIDEGRRKKAASWLNKLKLQIHLFFKKPKRK